MVVGKYDMFRATNLDVLSCYNAHAPTNKAGWSYSIDVDTIGFSPRDKLGVLLPRIKRRCHGEFVVANWMIRHYRTKTAIKDKIRPVSES